MSLHKSIIVKGEFDYEVQVGFDLLENLSENLPKNVDKVALIFPKEVSKIAKQVQKQLAKLSYKIIEIKIPSSENAKNIRTVEKCWDILGKNKFSRTDLIIGIGGGSTTDLAGFVAATWLRGIKFVSIPTTLLGMVDAAVGGKTGINSKAGKNLIGSFHNPSFVLCDIESLKTLKKHDFSTGMAEVVKCGFIQDPQILEIIEKYPDECKNFEGIEIPELITRSIKVKADVVGKDFKETSSAKTGREILNYGHTLGHAIEKIENYKWRHGDAVSIGMVYAAELAFAQGILSREIVQRHRDVVNIFKLPTTYKKKNFKKLIEIMAIDKKSRSGRLRFVVLEDIAKPTRLENPTFKVLNQAWEKISK